MNFSFERQAIPEVVLVTLHAFEDARGFFVERYKRSSYLAHGIEDAFVQTNHSFSRRGVLRGLHYQAPPYAHSKLVGVIVGEILDVAVDIRKGSPSYGQHVRAVLSAENNRQLYVPEGFAHGFLVLSEVAHVVYHLSGEFAPAAEGGVLWNDPALGIPWGEDAPLLSARDQRQPTLADLDSPFTYPVTQGGTDA